MIHISDQPQIHNSVYYDVASKSFTNEIVELPLDSMLTLGSLEPISTLE